MEFFSTSNVILNHLIEYFKNERSLLNLILHASISCLLLKQDVLL